MTDALKAALHAAVRIPNAGAVAALLREIPETLFFSEVQRRRGAKTVNRSGGKVWSAHRPGYSRCRCKDCNSQRVAAQ